MSPVKTLSLVTPLDSLKALENHMSFPFVTYERQELARETRLSPALKPKNCKMYRKFN